VFGDYVMFSTLSDADKRVKLGETKSGIKVLEINAPYSLKAWVPTWRVHRDTLAAHQRVVPPAECPQGR
jgi:hypothetical protein